MNQEMKTLKVLGSLLFVHKDLYKCNVDFCKDAMFTGFCDGRASAEGKFVEENTYTLDDAIEYLVHELGVNRRKLEGKRMIYDTLGKYFYSLGWDWSANVALQQFNQLADDAITELLEG